MRCRQRCETASAATVGWPRAERRRRRRAGLVLIAAADPRRLDGTLGTSAGVLHFCTHSYRLPFSSAAARRALLTRPELRAAAGPPGELRSGQVRSARVSRPPLLSGVDRWARVDGPAPLDGFGVARSMAGQCAVPCSRFVPLVTGVVSRSAGGLLKRTGGWLAPGQGNRGRGQVKSHRPAPVSPWQVSLPARRMAEQQKMHGRFTCHPDSPRVATGLHMVLRCILQPAGMPYVPLTVLSQR